MNKGLKALKEIKEKFFKKEGNITSGDLGLYNRLGIIERELKALEIIKEKPQTLYLVQTCENYDNYFNTVDITLMEYIYSKEEYDLLKEVLL